jgi:predicted aldo/keto reductase-like oxidoreductase
LDRAIEGGVNYFDTAYFYHKGASENFMSRALAQYPRGSYYLTSKLPTVLVHDLDEARRIFDEQWERLDRTYLDFYLLHNLTGAVAAACGTRASGLVPGPPAAGAVPAVRLFLPGSYDEFEEILTAPEWDLCQLQLNYMTPTSRRAAGYALTEKRGVRWSSWSR